MSLNFEMTAQVKVSVIIPFYKSELYLNAAVESVLCQSFQDFEIIAVDDGSSDQSLENLKKLPDPRIKIIRQENAGAAVARNTGVKEAKGEYIAFLDSDDLWAPGKLQLQLDALLEHKVNMVFGQVKEFNDISTPGDKTQSEKTFVGYSAITMLILKSDFLKVGWFNPQWKTAEFIDWYDRTKYLGFTEVVLPEILAFRRIHAGNTDRLMRTDVKQYVAVLKEALDRKRRGHI
ncbi:MAG: glycosyltransferase family 2 protein [Flavobacteriales bacterium]